MISCDDIDKMNDEKIISVLDKIITNIEIYGEHTNAENIEILRRLIQVIKTGEYDNIK